MWGVFESVTTVLCVILQLLQLNVEGLMNLVPHISIRNVSGNNTQLPENVMCFLAYYA